MTQEASPPLPEGIFSLLDTDLYKLTMQCAILKYFPDTYVTYGFTNRTADMKLTRGAYKWLLAQLDKLGNIQVTSAEIEFLKKKCPYFNDAYLHFLTTFKLKPSEQVEIHFTPGEGDTGSDEDKGDVDYVVKGLWVDTILYEIPLLALTSQAYFMFSDKDWDYSCQEEKAFRKGCTLLEHGCIFSEFGSRRRRDYHTQDLVMKGLSRAAEEGKKRGWKGAFTGTSNVHFAMMYDVTPVGTVAHEWYMTIAAITDDYENANEMALRYWLGCFGEGVLGVALTDTFGTPAFLDAFRKHIPAYTSAGVGAVSTTASGPGTTVQSTIQSEARTTPPISAPLQDAQGEHPTKTYAQVYTGVRQDSGDPTYFVKMVREFYDREGIKEPKTVVFSDSLDIEHCVEYKVIAEEAGFQPVFGVGTFFTNDFTNKSDGEKSKPLNIVIKISTANGRPAVKLSDNMGKNTGDKATVQSVKKKLGYIEHEWEKGDEKNRWTQKE
ncbi:nicotinate phosphoribosyltransferase [Aspergillus japonicus CBS 114.51]|uniref:nicotinate phosphoribosyltransferase n=2 Tax=Aspergillus TaxID=5052 RepID=A0A2V5GYX7_ASPV1|nr:nicotinate phosphoribosyltransferase [Aspergillus japonicus CBS 114.51]PYI16715.1 nicotinate phosphoribosyltransferase [Aspergillus violaceofuscus CBS 115571]RAH84026.1 nicotinate phosphoribosyltransferase [Aspergillus japonicus CBS 114.51]